MAVILKNHGIRILDKIFNFQWDVEYKKLLITSILGTTDFFNWLKKHDLLELYLKNIENASWASNEELYGSVVQGLNDVGNYTAMLQLVCWQLDIKKLDDSVKNEHIINALNGLEYNYNLEYNILKFKNYWRYCREEKISIDRICYNWNSNTAIYFLAERM